MEYNLRFHSCQEDRKIYFDVDLSNPFHKWYILNISIERLKVHEKRANEVINLALNHRNMHEYSFPETPFIRLAVKYEQDNHAEGFAANAVFLSSIFTRGGKTSIYYGHMASKEMLDKYAWLFKPEIVEQTNESCVINALKIYARPLGFASDGLTKWKYNCGIIHRQFDDDIRNFYKSKLDDSMQIINSIHLRNRAKSAEKIKAGTFLGYDFKLAQLAIQFTHRYGIYSFKNIDKSGFPPDVQINRIAVQTEIIKLNSPANINLIGVRTLVPELSKICEGKNIDPRLLQETLWYIGNNYCNNEDHKDCPLISICRGILKSTSYQHGASIRPEDLKPFKT